MADQLIPDDLNWIPLSEAARAWDMSREKIITAYWNDHVKIRRVGKTFLVSWSDMKEYFGEAITPITVEF